MGTLDLSFNNVYDPATQRVALDINKISLSPYYLGCSLQIPIFNRLGVEVNYKYQLQNTNQVIRWTSMNEISGGLFYNF